MADVWQRRSFLRRAFAALLGIGLVSRFRRAAAAPDPVRAPLPAIPWDRADFTYTRDGREFPGIALRLPSTGNAPGEVYAACRICPHQGCIFGYETDYEAVSDIIGIDLDNPVFFCRCHLSTYDPAKGGAVVYGPSPRPPWRFTLRGDGGDFVVVDLEEGAGELAAPGPAPGQIQN